MSKYASLLLAIALCCGTSLKAQSAQVAVGKLDENPVPMHVVNPKTIEGQTGIVAISCIIDENGKVTEASVSKSTNAVLEPLALEAVQKWDFKPGKKDGKLVKAKVVIPVRFSGQE